MILATKGAPKVHVAGLAHSGEREVTAPRTLAGLLRARAQAHGERLAIRYKEGDEWLSPHLGRDVGRRRERWPRRSTPGECARAMA